jgi:hypothetical protein
MPRLGLDRFLPHPFQFIIHVASYHSTLTYSSCQMRRELITAVARSTQVPARALGSWVRKPTRGMDVCGRLFSAYVVLCVGSGLATG